MPPPDAELQIFTLAMGLFGGLALFLYGMERMTESLKAVAGDRMRGILGALTANRFAAVITGAFVTAVIQSSSVTTVLVVGFITSGLMSMSQSIGVIMGANIGTTVTAQIIAFKVTHYALLIVAVGFGLMFFARSKDWKRHGAGILGLGLIFLGMGVMGDAMTPLRTYEPFLDWMVRLQTPALGILAGALFTALVQSSSATTGIVIVMAGQGLMPLSAGIALIFGANVGTCVTALLAAIGKPREALRAALVHVLFNVLGVLIWLPFIEQLAELVVLITPAAEAASEVARLAAETPRQVANAHSIFNVVNTVVFVALAPQFARVVERLAPDRPLDEARLVRARFLDAALLSTPALAVDRARMEIFHLGEHVQEMFRDILPAVTTGDRDELAAIAARDDVVDALHGHIVAYLGEITQTSLTTAQTTDVVDLMEVANDLESIGDLIETNLVGLGERRLNTGVAISPETLEVLVEFHATVARGLELALRAITEDEPSAAHEVIAMKPEIQRLVDAAAEHQARRLVAPEPKRLAAYSLETDILTHLDRAFYFCKRMARQAVPSETSLPGVLRG